MSSVQRIVCPQCGIACMEQEAACWQCGAPLKPAQPAPAPTTAEMMEKPPAEGLIRFDDGRRADAPEPVPPPPVAAPPPQTAMTLTGEVVERPAPVPTPGPGGETTQRIAATIGGRPVVADPTQAVMRLTFCKACGQQNDEGAVECRKCRTLLEVVALGSVSEIEPLPRAWGFDLLGTAWIILGFAAVYSGWFLVKTDPKHPGATWSDYFWTGIVVCAPGVLVFLRHHFCKVLFWAMTLASLLVWAVLGFVWLYVGLRITENGQIGLTWLAVLSGLSAISFLTVRQNDAFDFGF